MDLNEKLKNLPSFPGVYLMEDSLGGIIYVGKSKNLKNRVTSYFYKLNSRSPKVEKLIQNLKDFKYITTDTEFEAFILECKLIKELKPRYNRLMKNPLSYTYIMLDFSKEYPSFEAVKDINTNEYILYFGPFTSKNAVEKAINAIKQFYKISCLYKSNKNSNCLNYSLGLCLGMCLNEQEIRNNYINIIHKIKNFMNGSNDDIIKEMETKMLSASEEFNFELAAKYRDDIRALKYILSNCKAIKFIERHKNILMLESINEYFVKIFLISSNKIIFSEIYNIKTMSNNELNKLIKLNIIKCLKANEIIFSKTFSKDDIDEAHIIYNYLKNNSCKFILIPENYPDINYNLEDSIYELLS